MQTAYELLVSTGLQELNLNSGGKWSRKEFTSTASVQYGGSLLEYGTTYYWKIMTWDIKNVTGPYCSAQVFMTTDRPTDFTGIAFSTSAIIWKWRDNCKEAGTYTIFDGTTVAKSPVLGENTTYWMEPGLFSNTQCSRQVALNIGASTKFSNSYSRYTLAKVPTGFTVIDDNIGDHSVILQWMPEGGSHFAVARTSSQAKVNYVWLTTGIQPSTGTYTFYTDRCSLFARTTYSYILKGYNGDNIETSTTTAVTITTRQDTTPPGVPILIMLPPSENDGIRTNQEITITGMAVDGEPELRIIDLTIFDQTGFVLYQRGIDNNDIFDENVEIDWLTGLISGSIKINSIKINKDAGVQIKHRVATHIILQVTIEDYNDPENIFTSQGFSNAIKLLGESKALNAYLPSGKVAINPQAGEEVTIYYEVDNPCNVELGIYTITGDKVKSLVNTWRESGRYLEKWNGRNDLWGADVASGIYLIHCNIGGYRKIKKIAVMNE
jgi:hypothetical protein